MDIQSLIRLANQADFEGNYRVADKLTERAIRQAASIFKRSIDGFTSVGPTMMALLSGGNIVGTKKQMDPTHVLKKGKWVSPADAARIDAAHAADLAAAKANRAGKPKGGAAAPGAAAPGVVQTAPGGAPVAQAAAGTGPIHQSVGGAPTGPAIPGIVQNAPPGSPAAAANAQIIQNYYTQPPATTSRPRTKGNKGDKGDKGDTGTTGATGQTGQTGQTGLQGEAGAWWPGVVAGLASGTLTTAGVAAYLKSQGASDGVVRSITQKVSNPDFKSDFKSDQLALRIQANQMQNAQEAQKFVQERKGDRRFNTAQDFWVAATQAGHSKSMVNQIVALAKSQGFTDESPYTN